MMAGDTSLSRIVYRKDERGVILDSTVVIGDDETPEGFEDAVAYESQVWYAQEATPVDESNLTVTESGPDLRQTVDVILGDNQEGPSDPAGLTGDERNAAEAKAAADAAAEESADDAGEVPVPPKSGPGSGKQVWAAYAASKGVEVSEEDTRDDIIDSCEAAGVPTD